MTMTHFPKASKLHISSHNQTVVSPIYATSGWLSPVPQLPSGPTAGTHQGATCGTPFPGPNLPGLPPGSPHLERRRPARQRTRPPGARASPGGTPQPLGPAKRLAAVGRFGGDMPWHRISTFVHIMELQFPKYFGMENKPNKDIQRRH